ncbi:MAG: acyl-CoA dehydrogenase [Frankiales bacterium]|nr:acyl-CoA dehydrogenase [Frankiales bacterium]
MPSNADTGVGLRSRLRAWLADELPGFLRDHADLLDDRDRLGLAWEQHLAAAGWGAPGWPVEYGGMGLSITEQVACYEELARQGAPDETNRPGKRTFAPTLMMYGTSEQKQRYLPGLLSATEVWCQGFSEPEAGSDLASLRTVARPDGDRFLVRGQKVWSSNAAFADFMFALVRTDEAAERHRGISLVIIDMHAQGVEVRPIRKITGDSGFCEVFLDDVTIQLTDVVGPLNEGWRVAHAALTHERVINMVPRVVAMLRETEEARELAEGCGDPALAATAAREQAMAAVLRALCYRAVSVPPTEGALQGSYLKLAWSEAHQRFLRTMADHCTALHVRGAIDSVVLERWRGAYLESRAETIYAGTSEVQRTVITRSLMRTTSS